MFRRSPKQIDPADSLVEKLPGAALIPKWKKAWVRAPGRVERMIHRATPNSDDKQSSPDRHLRTETPRVSCDGEPSISIGRHGRIATHTPTTALVRVSAP